MRIKPVLTMKLEQVTDGAKQLGSIKVEKRFASQTYYQLPGSSEWHEAPTKAAALEALQRAAIDAHFPAAKVS